MNDKQARAAKIRATVDQLTASLRDVCKEDFDAFERFFQKTLKLWKSEAFEDLTMLTGFALVGMTSIMAEIAADISQEG